MSEKLTIEEQIALIEESRVKIHRSIDEKYDNLIELLRTGKPIMSDEIRYYDLGEPLHFFKGKKPAAIIYPSGEKVNLTTWRQVAKELLADCNSDPERHEAMMKLRYAIGGRARWALTDEPEGMDVPIKIDEGLYFEGKFDTEFLLKMLTKEIFDRVGYDYSFIEIELRGKEQTETPVEDEQSADTEEDESLVMRM